MMRLISLLLYAVSIRRCSAFQSTAHTYNFQTHHVPHQSAHNNNLYKVARLYGTKDDDNNKIEDNKKDSNDDNKAEYTNKLDIFGEPKNKPKIIQDEGEIRGSDRIKSCIPYILPLIDGDKFGHYLYERIPILDELHYVLLRPIVDATQAAPALILILFVCFALGPQLTGQSREVRFNAQQAILIDITLFLPQIISEAVTEADANFERSLTEPFSNFVFYYYVSLVVYSVVSNLRGKKPTRIPWISSAADYIIGPF